MFIFVYEYLKPGYNVVRMNPHLRPQIPSQYLSLGCRCLLCGQVQKKAPGPNKTLVEILWCAAAPQRIEWYLNNTRQRHLMCSEQLSLLPAGTTSNEALHAEINNWFRQTQVRISVDAHAPTESFSETLFNNIVRQGYL
jgi:hypothetical protein